jgi:hypothetical protein
VNWYSLLMDMRTVEPLQQARRTMPDSDIDESRRLIEQAHRLQDAAHLQAAQSRALIAASWQLLASIDPEPFRIAPKD